MKQEREEKARNRTTVLSCQSMTGGFSYSYSVQETWPEPGDIYKMGLYWVEVVSYSPKTRNVRYRRITAKGKPLAPVESMGRKRFEREAVPA